MLFSTLLSLLLLISLTLAVQTRSLASTRVYKKLTAEIREEANLDSVHSLVYPLFVQSVLEFEGDPPLKLNSTPYELGFNGKTYEVIAQDPGGLVDVWRTSEHIASKVLTRDQLSIRKRIFENGDPSMSLQELALAAGLHSFPDWLTTDSTNNSLNHKTRFIGYVRPNSSLNNANFFNAKQPIAAYIRVNNAKK